MHERIYEILVNENEITWQNILQDLVKKEDMNPWDIDVSRLSQMYIDAVKQLERHDFRVSGKVVLAAAVLLKIKSSRFLSEDMLEIDRIINASEMTEEEFYEDIASDFHIPGQVTEKERHTLIPRTPQPRKRKVSIYDLMEALDQALEVRRRRVINAMPREEERVMQPRKTVDLSDQINKVYKKVNSHYKQTKEKLTFSQLVPSNERMDKIHTFIPLLHLENLQKVNLEQEEHLADIDIHLYSAKRQVAKELSP
ncbi:MAG: segregation/condensation protein A [Candidatus Woesearchaeota archaeon]